MSNKKSLLIVGVLLIVFFFLSIVFFFFIKDDLDEEYPLINENMDNYIKEVIYKKEVAILISDEIGVKNNMTVKEKVDLIFTYIATKIEYQEDDIDGLRPIERTMLEKKGDCEDQSVLAAALLNANDVKAYLIKREPFTGNSGIRYEGHVYVAVKTNNTDAVKCGNEHVRFFEPTENNYNNIEDIGIYKSRVSIKCFNVN